MDLEACGTTKFKSGSITFQGNSKLNVQFEATVQADFAFRDFMALEQA
jgi:hypothetical protein